MMASRSSFRFQIRLRKWLLVAFFAMFCFLSNGVYSFVLPRSSHVSTISSPLIRQRNSSKSTITSLLMEQNDKSSDTMSKERLLGTGVLLTVPVAWGTYAPAVRYMYENVTPAVPGIVFSALYYIVACLTLQGILRLTSENTDNKNYSSAVTIAGVELGGYLFVGNWLQVTGLQTVPADRAAFLVQLTTLLVPLTQAFLNKQRIPLMTWVACALAFSGVVVMTIDPSTQQLSWGMGDVYILLAAMSYTLHVIRLGAYSTQTSQISPLSLAASKATVEAFLSIATVLVYITVLHNFEITTYVNNLVTNQISQAPVVGATVLWTGWVTCAYTIYAQSFGQARVTSPTDANLIYTTQPIFSAIFAYFLLKEELNSNGIIGGALIGIALYLIITANESDNNDNIDTPNSSKEELSTTKQQSLVPKEEQSRQPTGV